jgi:hypothetical protein
MTAVEWLEEKLDDALSDTDYLTWKLVCEAVKEVKVMEKQQIIDSYASGYIDGVAQNKITAEQYYNDTFKKE